jgi:hypothetical protein
MTSVLKRKTDQDASTGMFLSSSKPIPLQYVVKNIEERVSKDDLYSDLGAYIPFLACFLVFFLAGRDIENNHMAASAVRGMYLTMPYSSYTTNAEIALAAPPNEIPELLEDKNFLTITRAKDWHKWFRDVLIPQTWDCDNPGYSRQTLFKKGQMQYLGAMKLRVILMKNNSCRLIDGMKNYSSPMHTPCYSEHNRDTEENTPMCGAVNPANALNTLWTFRGPNDVPGGVYTTGSQGIYHAGGYQADIPFNATCDMVRQLQDLVSGPDPNCNIIDDTRTRFVIAEWFQYAANTDTFLTVKLFMEIGATGGWISNYQVRMFPVWTTKRVALSVFDIFFFLFVLYFFYRLIYDWVVFYRRNRKILAFCFDLWNILEITNIATFFAVFILRWMWWSSSQKSKVSFPFDPVYPIDLDKIVLLFSGQIYANSVNVVITMIKMLKFVRLNNRLNVLTRTLDVAQQSVFGVLLLFLFVVTGFSICGTTLYGSNLLQFRNVNTAFSSLMFMLLGQMFYDDMRAQQPVLTGFFFFTYVVLAQFLLLNFIIAILSDGFAKVGGETALEPLDQAILRQLSMLKYHLNPRNLKKILELRVKKRTRTELLVEVAKYLKEHMDLIEMQAPELLDSELPMHKSDFRQWLPEQLNQDLGDYYTDLLWDDMEHDYRIDAQAEDYQEKRDIEATVKEGVMKVFGAKLHSVDRLEAACGRIEDLVEKIAVLAQEVFE